MLERLEFYILSNFRSHSGFNVSRIGAKERKRCVLTLGLREVVRPADENWISRSIKLADKSCAATATQSFRRRLNRKARPTILSILLSSGSTVYSQTACQRHLVLTASITQPISQEHTKYRQERTRKNIGHQCAQPGASLVSLANVNESQMTAN